jgi:hypothetical protein
MFYPNDDAAAYTFAMSIVFLIVIAIVWAFLMVGMNPVVTVHNNLVQQGKVGTQSHWAAVMAVGELLAIPGIILLGILIAVTQRSVEISQAGGRF